MAECDWGEVRRLAADLQRLQQSSTAHRLTERNCIELVATLVNRNLLEIVYTLDGKEYITPEQLVREIKEELSVHGGRINVVDLQQALNVDLSHIEARISEMIKHDRSLTLLHGEIIERTYMQHLCEEISDLVEETGQASLADLSRNFNLPINFLIKHIEVALENSIIRGELDRSETGIIYTESYVKRYKARIRGVFNAFTVPMAISTIITEGKYQEKLFNSLLQQLISNGEICGYLQGRQDKAVYIPHVYVLNQNKWADSFLEANGYLEYDALSRLGIDEPHEFISNRYSKDKMSGDLLLLSTCCVGKAVMSRIEGMVEEVLGSAEWADAMPLLPTPCTVFDAELLLKHFLPLHPELRIFGSIVTTTTFLHNCCDLFKLIIAKRAQKAASGRFTDTPVFKGDEKKSSRKRGGRKGGKIKYTDQEDECGMSAVQSKFMNLEEITTELSKSFPDCPVEFLSGVATKIESSLQDLYVNKVQECISTTSHNTSASELRKKHSDLQEKLQALWNMLQLFEKATLHFEGDTMVQLNRFLLRTVCSDLFNLLLKYVAEDNGLNFPPETALTVQVRQNVIDLLPTTMKKKLTSVHSALSGKVAATFLPLFEDLCREEYCGVLLKKLEKKKERQLLFSHQQSLLKNLQCEQQPSMVLHLVVVILFQQTTNCAIHVSGKLIPQIINFLQCHLEQKTYTTLNEFETLLVKCISKEKDSGGPINSRDESECVVSETAKESFAETSEVVTLKKQVEDMIDDMKQLVVKHKTDS